MHFTYAISHLFLLMVTQCLSMEDGIYPRNRDAPLPALYTPQLPVWLLQEICSVPHGRALLTRAHPDCTRESLELRFQPQPLPQCCAERTAPRAAGGPCLPAHSWVGETIPH